MHYTFEHAQGYLRADLFGRQTVEETLQFIDALAAEARKPSTLGSLQAACGNAGAWLRVQSQEYR